MTAGGSRRVLVTGAGGFVGANLVRRLLADGHDVTALSRAGGSDWRLADLAGQVRLAAVDVRDGERLGDAIRQARPEIAFHLATHGAYEWQRDAASIFSTALLGTVHVVEACRRVGCERLVNAGSSSEYGFKDHAPGEDESLEPASEYGVAKAAATLYCRQAAGADMETVTLRLYSVYGPFEDPRRLIPALVVHGLRGELPPLVDADTARDFVAVDDVLDAFVLAGAGRLPEPGRIYNVGSGRQTTIAEAAQAARKALGVEVAPRFGSAEPRRWDTTTWVARIQRIEAELGWRPRVTLEDGLGRMADWLRGAPQLWERYGVERISAA